MAASGQLDIGAPENRPWNAACEARWPGDASEYECHVVPVAFSKRLRSTCPHETLAPATPIQSLGHCTSRLCNAVPDIPRRAYAHLPDEFTMGDRAIAAQEEVM